MQSGVISSRTRTQSGVIRSTSDAIRSHQEHLRCNQESSAAARLVRPHVELRDDARGRYAHLGARLEQREVRRANKQRSAAKLGKVPN
jgi:hypothetical protein